MEYILNPSTAVVLDTLNYYSIFSFNHFSVYLHSGLGESYHFTFARAALYSRTQGTDTQILNVLLSTCYLCSFNVLPSAFRNLTDCCKKFLSHFFTKISLSLLLG